MIHDSGSRPIRSGGVPQFVGVETGNSELFGCASEHRPLKDLCAEGAAPLTSRSAVTDGRGRALARTSCGLFADSAHFDLDTKIVLKLYNLRKPGIVAV